MLDPLPNTEWSRRNATHLLNRAGFGGSPSEREALFQLGRAGGVAAAVSSLLDGDTNWQAFPPPAWSQDGQNNGNTIAFSDRLFDTVGWILGMMDRGQSAAAKMLKFYADHFPIDISFHQSFDDFIYSVGHFKLLREHALGNFATLVKAMAWNPAMMRRLDLHLSARSVINENFAREFLELFTMGIDAGYSEDDVHTLARCFAGRKLSNVAPFPPFLDTRLGDPANPATRDKYVFIDAEEKSFLGHLLPALTPGTPPLEHGELAADIILARPETGRHLAWKLWRYFVAPDPSPSLIVELGSRFQSYAYEVKPLLRDIFQSADFYFDSAIGRQVKDPVDLFLSTSKILGMPSPGARAGHRVTEDLGMNLLSPPEIDGWPEPEGVGNQWINDGTMLRRINIGSLWSHGNHKAVTSHYLLAQDLPLPAPDLDELMPPHLRHPRNFHLLLDHLTHRLTPFHPLSQEKKRRLRRLLDFDRQYHAESEWARDILRLLLAQPEFQLQ